MSKATDILVIGSGMAGLMAAYAAINQNCNVRVMSEGMGCLSISGGCIDLLGYADNSLLQNPWDGIDSLPDEHPYKILGHDKVKEALETIKKCLGEANYPYHNAVDENGTPMNVMVPTCIGTLKPTYLIPEDLDWQKLQNSKKVLLIGVTGFRDFRPHLIRSQLRRYKNWAEKDIGITVLPEPFKEGARSLNALDLAHVGDRKHGHDWLISMLKDKGKDYDLALLPPMLGAMPNSKIRKDLPEALGCPCVELQSIPPGVGGLRLRHAFEDYLVNKGVEFFENAQVIKSEVKDGHCINITAHSTGRDVVHEADAIVVATGGIISGGIVLGEGTATESIFNIPLNVPADVDEWTTPEIFGKHLLTSLGIKVNANMQAIEENNTPILDNVFFAGRTIGGYDYAAEKSGYGVAIATGLQAGKMAAGYVEQKNKSTGANQ